MMALAIIVSIPIFLLFLFFQRAFMQGSFSRRRRQGVSRFRARPGHDDEEAEP